MSKYQADITCTRRCKSRIHGHIITSAITKRSISDKALASYIRATCVNFTKAFDHEGRTALLMAASRGRPRLMEWLVRHSTEAFINARDRESGYTPLHRSIFYGQIHCAVNLLKMGVKTDILDKDDYKALEHATLDRHYMYKHEGTRPSDAYVWGSNSNYTLGTGTQQQRNIPELLGYFSRNNCSVEQVCLGRFHSVWICNTPEANGAVWCCGQTVRAGGPRFTALRPTPIALNEACVAAAVTLGSTVLMMQSGAVLEYTISSADNTSPASTKTATIKLPSIKPVIKISQPIGVCSGRCHVAVWNTRAVYTWGTNLGQLGHSQKEKLVPVPKKVLMNTKEDATIQFVAASDAATVITTSRGDVYLLHKHITKKIAIKQINLRQVCVEAKVNEQSVYSRVTVLLLTSIGQVLVWQDTANRLTRCVFGVNHQITVTNITLTHDAMYFTTKHGEAFVGYISRKTTPSQPQPIKKKEEKEDGKSALVKFLEKDDCTPVRIVRIPNIHRAVSIAVDSEGLNFVCLQIKPTCGLVSVPEWSPSSMSKHMEMLLETASEDDLLYDVVFKVGTKLFPAHVFIIASNSELLYKMYIDNRKAKDAKPTVVLENVIPEAFERILKYMYTGSCDVAEIGLCSLKIKREDIVNSVGKKDDNNVEEAETVIENSLEISAFEAYKTQNKSKRNRQRRSQDTPVRSNLYCDPVKLVQAAAKRLQVMGLHKLLDSFVYRDGVIHLKTNAVLQKTQLQLQRSSFPELVDTNVCSKDGVLIPAHKCVLAARLEYFHGMFIHSWTESTMLSTVTLPINHGVLLPVIDFLYTDTCPEVENSDSIDFICSMLIVADQLFITRLREMCEVTLSGLVTLKNCHELCQFAHTYNATQLKQSCMEFISLNIANILESRCLEQLEEKLLEDITQYYCSFNPIMSSRVITPFCSAPSDEVIEEIEKNNPVDLGYTDIDLKKEETIEITTKKKKSKKIEYTESEKARMRYESVSSVTSLDLSNDKSGDITLSLTNLKEVDKKNHDKWIEIPSTQQKQQKIVQARMKAICSAKEILNEAPTESFTKLTRSPVHNTSSPIMQEVTPTTSRMSVSPNDSFSDITRSPQSLVINHIGPKLSQKQRKKLALQNNEQSPPQSLDDFLNNKLTLNSPPEPKNPWKVISTPEASSSPVSKQIQFDQILADQKKQKDDFSRIMTKPLALTQLEDKAIEDLEKFYNVHNIDDELITVRRIEVQVSSPQWINTAPK